MIQIELTPHELLLAGIIGVSRHVKGAWKKGRYGVDNSKTGWQIDCDGACGELATSKWLGSYYNGNLGNFLAKDAGRFQVRTTAREDGHLRVHRHDSPTDVFIMVLSHRSPIFLLRGWAFGWEAQKDEYWRDGAKGRPAFWFPQDKLRDMCELVRDADENYYRTANSTVTE